jgi:signal transduction histidine kinase
MSLPGWLRTPRSLLVVFLVIVLLPSALLVVSGWRLLQQEDSLAIQERQTRREQMADDLVTILRQRIEPIEARLRDPRAEFTLPSDREDFVFAAFTANTVRTTPSRRLLYYPVTMAGREAPPAAIAEAVSLRRLGRTDAALAAYSRAAAVHDVLVAGVPADLFARWAECQLLAEAGRKDELKLKAGALYSDVLSGRWQLSRTHFEAQEIDLAQWSGATSQPQSVETARALSAAVDGIWQKWHTRPADLAGSGHELSAVNGRHFTLLWHGSAERLAVFVAGTAFVDTQWLSETQRAAERQQLRVSLREPGASVPNWKETRRSAEETRLPWTIAVADTMVADAAASRGRFRIWLAGVALLSLIVIGGATVTARAAARELAVARLQSDFVAAVSHEFRTPLTSLRQIGEVLHEGRVGDDRRPTYYEALLRQTERLHHLVETLLDFGRMEAGRSPYRKEPMDLASWARSVVTQFNREVSARGYTVEFTAGDEPIPVSADAQALTNALWNLLDNAVKYSPASRTVEVVVERRGNDAAVHVRDRGLGISAAEQREIFGKFVRGAEAKRQNIAGTGIGLAMVQHIVKAHGGRVRVESQPESGSTFSLEIPCHAS